MNDPETELISEYVSKYYFTQFEKISSDAYEFAANNKNIKKLVEVLLEILKSNDPEKANIEQANKIAEQMQLFAKKKLEELSKK